MEKFPEDSYYLQCMKTILDAYPQHSPPVHPTQLTDSLYIGNQDNADDVTLLADLGITHVLNCAGTRNFDLTRSPYPPGSSVRAFLMIPAQDYDEFNIMQFFEPAIDFLESASTVGGCKALVHCSIGVNRSGAVAAAFLMASQRKRLMDVIVELKAKRLLVLCNMGFRKQLVQFARANGLLDRIDLESAVQRRQPAQLPVRPEKTEPEERTKEDASSSSVEAPRRDETRRDETRQNGVSAGIDGQDVDGGARGTPGVNGVAKEIPAEGEKAHAYRAPAKAVETSSYSKKYVYRTRTYLPESGTSKYQTSASAAAVASSSSDKTYKNVDSDILVKLLNESYDKYKLRTSKVKDANTPRETASSLAALISASAAASSSPSSLLALPSKSLAKRSSERELTREVEEFLSSSRIPLARKTDDAGRLLAGMISKEDERLIWGKPDLLYDPEFLLYKDSLEKSPPSSSPLLSIPHQLRHHPTTGKTKDLEDLLKKYQETTNNVVLRNLQELAEAPTRPRYGSARTSELFSTSVAASREADGQNRKAALTAGSLVSRDSPKEAFGRVFSAKSPGIKPISYYRLQVMSEKNARDPELQQAANEYLLSTNGH